MQSVLPQLTDEIEIILVDDGSPDGCGALCDKYASAHPDSVSVIHQNNMGLSGARNTGLGSSRGEYVFFLDSDDTIERGALSVITAALERHGYPDMLVFGSRIVDEDGNILLERIPASFAYYGAPQDIRLNAHDEKEILLEYHGAWCRVTKKDVFTQNNISFPLGLWYEDLATTPVLLACSSSVVFIEDILYRYLKRPGSIMHSSNLDRSCGDLTAVIEIYIDWFKAKGLFDEFYSQLEFFAINKLLLIKVAEIIKTDYSRKHIKMLTKFVSKHFGNYVHNIYLRKSNFRDQLKVTLLNAGLPWLLSILYKLDGKQEQ